MCCTAFLKTMMFAFNGIVFLAGAIMLGLGIWVRVDEGSLEDLLWNIKDVSDSLTTMANVSYIMIAVGAVLLITGFLGCCGVVMENRCMLVTFFVLLLIIFIGEIAMAVLLFAFKDETAELFEKMDEKIVEKFEERFAYGNVTSHWASTMQKFKCCGYFSYKNFPKATVFPGECCVQGPHAPAVCNRIMAKLANINGCRDKIVEEIKNNAVIVGAVAVVVAVVQVAAMAVSVILYKDIGHKHRHH